MFSRACIYLASIHVAWRKFYSKLFTDMTNFKRIKCFKIVIVIIIAEEDNELFRENLRFFFPLFFLYLRSTLFQESFWLRVP